MPNECLRDDDHRAALVRWNLTWSYPGPPKYLALLKKDQGNGQGAAQQHQYGTRNAERPEAGYEQDSDGSTVRPQSDA